MITNEQVLSLHKVLTYKDLKGFESYGTPITWDEKKEDGYIHLSRPGSKILAVAHTDYVEFQMPRMSYNRKLIACGQLDDRLGAWIILEFLHTLLPENMPYDILLTDQEEKGNSTAQHFDPKGKVYNWMFEWDRHGVDVVMYDYETKHLRDLLTAYDFKVGTGSFTDIGMLAHLGCPGFNFGTGYYQEHSKSCHAKLEETFAQLDRFAPFYKDYYDIKLKGNQKEARRRQKGRMGWSSSNNNHGYYKPSTYVLTWEYRMSELKPKMEFDEYSDWQKDCEKVGRILVVEQWRQARAEMEAEEVLSKKKDDNVLPDDNCFDPKFSKTLRDHLGIEDEEYEQYKSYCVEHCVDMDFDTWKQNPKDKPKTLTVKELLEVKKLKKVLVKGDAEESDDISYELEIEDDYLDSIRAQTQEAERVRQQKIINENKEKYDNPTDKTNRGVQEYRDLVKKYGVKSANDIWLGNKSDPYDPSDDYFKIIPPQIEAEDWDNLSEEEWKRKKEGGIDWDKMTDAELEEAIADTLGDGGYRSDQYYDETPFRNLP